MKALPLLCLLATPALAHDMWLQPPRAHGKAGAPVQLRLAIGEKMVVEETRPLGLQRVTRFDFVDQGSVRSMLDQPLRYPSGSGVLFMERTASVIAVDGAKFDAYLVEEGHFDVLRGRVDSGKRGAPARERYTRHLKTVLSSDTSDQDYRYVFGGRLEIVPLSNPIAATTSVEFLVLFDAKPLIDARVSLYGGEPQHARTNRQGKVRFNIHEGAALVRTTFLRACSRCEDADYESFWASLTFEAGPIQTRSGARISSSN